MGRKIDLISNNPGAYEAAVDYQDFFQTIFSSGLLGVAFTDREGNIRSANKEFERHLAAPGTANLCKLTEGLQPKEAGTTWLVYVVPVGSGHVTLCRRDLAHEAPNGSCLWLSLPANEAAEDLYYSFADNTFELVFRTSPAGNLLFWNRLFSGHFGVGRRTGAQVNAETLFEDAETYHTLTQRTLVEKRLANETVCFSKPDGSRLTGLVNCLLQHTEAGEPVVNWTVLDVSHQHKTEEDLRIRNSELAKINAQMEKFLYSASHDLRSPLTSIFGLANLLRIDSADAVVQDYARKIEQCTGKLDTIIQDIICFAKTTYQHISSEAIDLEQMLWKLINVQYNDPDFNKIHFEVRVEGSHPFYSDPKRVGMMLDNIIHNAIVFVDDTKVKPFMRIHGVVSPHDARLEIIDNGIGIGRQHLDNIFNMFYRASDKSRGAGLGLYIVKENVDRLRAAIEVESEIGFGSVFRLTIPNDLKDRA